MNRKRMAGIVAAAMSFSMLLGACKPNAETSSANSSSAISYDDLQEKTAPKIDGTFIQSWLCSSWDDARWEEELTHYQQIGIKYIIMGDTATYNSKDKKWYAFYPTEIEDVKIGWDGKDTIGNALRNCQKFGMKVFVGLGSNDDYWNNIKDADWMNAASQKSAEIANELYAMYYEQYSDTFYGWYWVPEIWNDACYGKLSGDRDKNIQTLADAFSICLDDINSLNPNLPMLWSPFVNPSMMGAEETYAFWRDVIKAGHFRAGDIICPMDSINNFTSTYDGKTGCEIKYLDVWEKAYRRAVDDSGKGVKFWSNCEGFNSKVNPAEPAVWARLVRQMQIASKYTDTIITFAYAHYQSPYRINKYVSDTYIDYLKNGKLETEPPTAPTNVKITINNGKAAILWDASTDNIGVAGYYVYRNGEQIEQTYTSIDGPNMPVQTEASDWDAQKYVNKDGKVTYEVMAYDSAGNYSDKTSVTLTKEDFK